MGSVSLFIMANIPKLNLAHLPTPLEKLSPTIFGEKLKTQIFIKRDDFTRSVVSGNKVRKLEYIFKHVIDNGFTTVISCGGIQSNHARAVAAVSAKLGIECHLILRIPN